MRTFVRLQAAIIVQVEVGKRAMNVRAYLLPGLGGSKDAYDRDLKGMLSLRRYSKAAMKLRVEFRGSGLVVIDAIETKAEDVHQGQARLSFCLSKVVGTTSIMRSGFAEVWRVISGGWREIGGRVWCCWFGSLTALTRIINASRKRTDHLDFYLSPQRTSVIQQHHHPNPAHHAARTTSQARRTGKE